MSAWSASEVDQTLGDTGMRPRESAASGLEQTPFVWLEQIDGEPLGAQQLRDPLDRGLERVGQGELRDRLADDGHERAAALQLHRLPLRPLARAQSVRRARRERRQCVEHLVGGDERLLEAELEGARRGLSEQQDPRA